MGKTLYRRGRCEQNLTHCKGEGHLIMDELRVGEGGRGVREVRCGNEEVGYTSNVCDTCSPPSASFTGLSVL
jgi:hypothetical protein